MGSQRANQLVEAGLWLRLSGDAQGAQKLFERALELDPQNVRARDCLASLEASPGKSSPFSPGPLDAGTRGTPLASLVGDWGAWAEGEGGPLDEEDEERSPSVLIPDVDEPTPGSDVLELLARDESTTQEYGVPEGETDEYGVPATESELERLLRGAADLLELDDHSGAVDLLFKAQELAPGDPRVEALRARSERMLMAMLESKLGDLGRVPRVRLQADDIIWLSLDHRAGFVLAQIDGAVTFEDLFSLSGMTRLDTARILAQLLDEGVIAAA